MDSSQAVQALAALAHETRLAIFRMLVETGPEGLPAGVIAERLQIPPSSLTFHVQHLHRAGLVTQRRLSRQLIYVAVFDAMGGLVGYLTENCCGGNAALCQGPEIMSITVYHNPACGTSRNVLALIRARGSEPRVIEYLKTPPSRAELVQLIARMGVSVRDVLRQKGTPYDELNLANPALSDDALIDAMMANPILINRPIVVTPDAVKLCRPSETVLEILPKPAA